MTPDEIAAGIVLRHVPPGMCVGLKTAIAAAIAAERAAREKAEAERDEARRLLAKSDAGWEAEAGRRLEAREAALREAADHFLQRHNNNWDKHNIAWAILALIDKPQREGT